MGQLTAAHRLHLHVNTAYYRLERIAERTGCDLRRFSVLAAVPPIAHRASFGAWDGCRANRCGPTISRGLRAGGTDARRRRAVAGSAQPQCHRVDVSGASA
ncbi:helix-turn-helix domain-containing protein [Streptomyces sp. NPDC002867]